MIYHLTTEDFLQKALNTGSYNHPSLKENGYIYCLKKEKVLTEANSLPTDCQDVVILSIVEKRLGEKLKWEAAGNPEERLPKVYGSIPLEAIESIDILEKDNNGKFIWPESK